MKNEADNIEISQDTMDRIANFAKAPVQVDDFSFMSNADLVQVSKHLNLKYLELFFTHYPELKSIKEIDSIITYDLNIWKMFSEVELSELLNLLDKYQIKDELIKNDVLNSLAIYFIYADLYSIQKNELYLKVKKLFEFLNFYKKKQLKDKIAYREYNSIIKLDNFNIKDEKLNGIETIPSFLFNLINYLKFPAKKPINPTINFFVAKITDAAINSGIKRNFTECAIPLIKELKQLYPNYFNEITSYNSDYFSAKAKLGRTFYRETNS